MDETIKTKALSYARLNFRQLLAYAVATISTIVSISVGVGRHETKNEMDAAKMNETLIQVTTKLDRMSDKVDNLAVQQAQTTATLNAVHEEVLEVKEWKERVTGVADTFRVPKLTEGHRAKKP